jgi:hypothetical protein
VPLSDELAQKSVLAAISAIEIYNKPHFLYREEAFALLMANAWELLLKAKWALEHKEAPECLHEISSDGKGGKTTKLNRSGNPLTHGLPYLAAKLVEDKKSGLLLACHDNILALLEIRDNAAHFMNKDLYLGRRVLEVGTASLRNYLQLATDWFKLDLSIYNFFLMPISFYHGFESVEVASRGPYPEQVHKLLGFLDKLEQNDTDDSSPQRVSIRLETRLVKSKDAAGVAIRITNDPNAPAMVVSEEDVLKNYPLTYNQLTGMMRKRYSDFGTSRKYHALRLKLQVDQKFSIERALDPRNPKSARQRFFNANILQEFDKVYIRK